MSTCTYPAMKGKHCGCWPNGNCCACGAVSALMPVEIVSTRHIHREKTDDDAKFYRRDEVDAVHREIIDKIDKTQSCTSGMSNSECLAWVKGMLR